MNAETHQPTASSGRECLVSLGTRALRAMCRRRADLVIENLALRQQATALKKERPRPPLEDVDPAFWVALRDSWPGWANRLVLVKADTVAQWNRERFRRYWTRISRRRYPGRPRFDGEIRRLVRTMAQDGWGAPRIHAELTKLGFIISEKTVSRYMPRRPAEPDELGQDKDTPNARPVKPRPSPAEKLVALPKVGGLHHRYEWREAA